MTSFVIERLPLAPLHAPSCSDINSGPLDSECGAGRRLTERERLFAMHQAFLSSGSIVTVHTLLVPLRLRVDQPISLLARWIVRRDVVHFEACSEIWLPMFQFEPGIRLRPGIAEVIGELRGVFDDWELAQWFAAPNVSLGGRSPSDAIERDPSAVLQTARLDTTLSYRPSGEPT